MMENYKLQITMSEITKKTVPFGPAARGAYKRNSNAYGDGDKPFFYSWKFV